MQKQKKKQMKQSSSRIGNRERILIVATIICFTILSVKSLYIDQMHIKKNFSPAQIERLSSELDLSGGIFPQKIVRIRAKDETLKITARRYILHIMPIGDSFYDVKTKHQDTGE